MLTIGWKMCISTTEAVFILKGLIRDDLLRQDIRDDPLSTQLTMALRSLFGPSDFADVEPTTFAPPFSPVVDEASKTFGFEREVSEVKPELKATTDGLMQRQIKRGRDTEEREDVVLEEGESIAAENAAGKAIKQSIIHFEELYKVGTFKNLRGKGAVMIRIKRMLRPILEAEEYEAIHDTNNFMNNLADYIYDRFEEKSLGPQTK